MKLTAERNSAIIKRLLTALAPMALCVALALGCGQEPDLRVPSPTPPPPLASYVPYPQGAPTLDENIFHADVIALALPPVVEGMSKTVPSENGVAPTYRPFVEFRFEVAEYLKGSGGSALTVEYPKSHTYLTNDEALSAATRLTSDRSAVADRTSSPIFGAGGDDRGAAIFLQLADDVDARPGEPSQVYYFASTQSPFNPDYINTSRKSWLPIDGESSGKSISALAGDSETKLINIGPASSAEPSELTLGHLRSRVKAIAATLAEGEGVDGYEECVAFRFASPNQLRVIEEVEGKPYVPKIVREGPFASGLPAGSEFRSSWSGGAGYIRYWYEGRDADLFQVAIVEDGVDVVEPDYFATRDILTSYDISTRVARPLPSGTYEVKQMAQAPVGIPCDLYSDPAPDLARTWIFTFESPDGTLHEAFFDPAAMDGGGAGADGDNGVLKPAAFSLADGTGASLQSIEWRPSAVEMRLEPRARLSGYHADFIALDGSVSLRLDFDDASEIGEGDARALSWPVCVRPWESGDLLMLRISESPPNLTGATRDTACADARTPAE